MQSTTKHILIVDDNAEDRAYARHLLSKIGNVDWQVSEASNGSEALELAFSHGPFDCILLDYHMPDLTGIEFLELLKDRLGEQSIATVMLTGSGDESIAMRAIKVGANDFLVKDGLNKDSLFHAIEYAIENFQLKLSRQRTMQQLQRANEELQRSNEDLQHFAYALSHDLKSPLRTVSVFTELLSEYYGGKDGKDAESEKLFNVIQSNVRRASQLIEDLLAHARSDSPYEVQGQVTCVQAALVSTLESLNDELQDCGGEIIYEALPAVIISRTQLERVLQNIIANALKYRRESVAPRIEISAYLQGTKWVISIQDNGQGFEQEYAELIFKPFKRLHGSEYSGSGIGLATCRKIIERNGGKIWVESKPAIGSTFYFSLPFAQIKTSALPRDP